MSRFAKFAVLCAGLAVSACSGSGGSGSVIGGGSTDYNTLISEAGRLSTRLGTLTATTTLPSGGATYSGVVALADDFDTSTTGVVGAANLTANFGASTISGTGTGFYETAVTTSGGATAGSGTPVAGSLNFSGSGLGTVFILDVDGTVTIEGTPRTIAGSAAGAFFGPSAEMIAAFGTDLPTTSTGYDVDIAIVAD